MKIILHDSYKSLQPFKSAELPDLTVITGKNGSGKTQLLHLLSKYDITINFNDHEIKIDSNVVNINIEIGPEIYRAKFEGITKDGTYLVGEENIKTIMDSFYTQFSRLSPSFINVFNYLIRNKLFSNFFELDPNSNIPLSDDPEYKQIIYKEYEKWSNQDPALLEENNFAKLEYRVISLYFSTEYIRLIEIIKYISEYHEKEIKEITHADFYKTPIPEDLINNNDLFALDVEFIFFSYANRRHLNELDYFRKEKYNENNNSISDDEFVKKNIPPWDIINDIMEKHNIDYYFKRIDKKDIHHNTQQLRIDLFKKSTNSQIPLYGLSSGEKRIIGLIFILFTSKYYNEDFIYPDLLILDEPDAHFHPEMAKLFLDIIKQTFVDDFKIKVIFTTHSPTTIALAPEESIFQLTNENDTALKKISKDDALKVLTGLIPILSIDYKNHKQVFVESPTDVNYYQNIYNKYCQNKDIIPKLYFISNCAGKGNCDQVCKIVKNMRNSGNSTSYGIIDWDLKNNPEEYIFVHGHKERYSIENYLLDPIYVYCLLIDMNNAYGIREKIGEDSGFNHYLIGNKTSEELQKIIILFFQDFEKKYPALRYDTERITVVYFNDKKVVIPKWYFETKGHDLITKVKEIYPALKNKYQNEGELQNNLSVIIARCFPFVPLSTINLLEQIRSV